MMTLKNPGLVIKENVSFILMKNTLFTFQDGIEGDVFNDIRNRISNNTGKIRRSPIDYLLWRLLDIMIKQYFKVFESYRTEVEIIEDKLIYNHTKIQISEVIQIKREINEIRKLVLPLKNGLSLIKQESNHLIHKSTMMYFKDLLDQLNNLENSILTSRELIKDVIELENANQTHTMNQIMKLLTIMSSIFIPLTFIVGVYGMNFDNMPELHYRYGYHFLWVTMICIGFSLWYFFRRRNWL